MLIYLKSQIKPKALGNMEAFIIGTVKRSIEKS